MGLEALKPLLTILGNGSVLQWCVGFAVGVYLLVMLIAGVVSVLHPTKERRADAYKVLELLTLRHKRRPVQRRAKG